MSESKRIWKQAEGELSGSRFALCGLPLTVLGAADSGFENNVWSLSAYRKGFPQECAWKSAEEQKDAEVREGAEVEGRFSREWLGNVAVGGEEAREMKR